MCVAIFKPYNKHISKDDLRSCFVRNPDGAGFMYPLNGKMVVQKGYFTFDAFYKAFREHETGPAMDTGIAIHFRIGTSGNKDEVNCHPHVIGDDFAFIHNGIMNDFAYAKSPFSDTIHFRDEVLTPFYEMAGEKFLHKGYTFALIEEFIGTNKMLFMNGEGKYWIANKKQWTDVDGVIYSNMFWKTYTAQSGSSGYYGNNSTQRTGSFRYGCYLNGSWANWKEYRDKYPEKNGPYEQDYGLYGDYVEEDKRVLGFRNRHGEYYDSNLKAWVKGKPGKKKNQGTCEDPQGCPPPTDPLTETTTQSTIVSGKDIGAEIDENGFVLPVEPTNVVTDAINQSVERIQKEMEKDAIAAEFQAAYEAETGEALFPEGRCVNCKKDLQGDELTTDERMCATCLIWLKQAQGVD